MRPAKIIFDTFNNEAWLEGFTIEDDAATLLNLNAYRPVTMQVKPAEFYPKPALDLSEGSGLMVESDGALTINVPAASMAPLYGEYRHDIRGTAADGALIVLAYGTVRIKQGTTI